MDFESNLPALFENPQKQNKKQAFLTKRKEQY